MSAEAVQNALVDLLRNDTDIFTEFGVELEGTLTFTLDSASVVGVDTLFITNLKAGDYIRAQGSLVWYRIRSIEGELGLTLEKNFAEANFTGKGEFINISKGMGRNFNYQEDILGIRIYQTLENYVPNTTPHARQDVAYPFLVNILFFEPDDVYGEERKTAYGMLVRRALDKDIKLGGLGYNSGIGDTRYTFHPNIEGSYYVTIPYTLLARVQVG